MMPVLSETERIARYLAGEPLQGVVGGEGY